jgi:VWFA-related protein
MNYCHRRFALSSAILAVLLIPCGHLGAQGQSGDKAPDVRQAAPTLKVESNLVLVRAVVRDAQGHPVKGLKKEDFKLFDRGKLQPIAQFEEESPVEAPPTPITAAVPGQPAPPPPIAPPERFLAFYFDNLNTSAADLMQGRDAADKLLAAGLRPQDRVAIFTVEKMLSDFTSDPKQIHEALSQVHLSPRAPVRGMECPELSDYQAKQLLQTNDLDSNAWRQALAEAKNCPTSAFSLGGSDPGVPQKLVIMIRTLAHRVVEDSEMRTRVNLGQFEQVVKFISNLPGQRTVILVSPGFLPEDRQVQLDQIIDKAVRTQVVIDSLNPKGLSNTMRESDASRGNTTGANVQATAAMHTLDAEREFVASDPLAEVAEGTGGQFIHDDNDLKAGFAAFTEQPPHYTLAFIPQEIKRDGKFHPLKVTLAESRKGYSIQARRGYFVPAVQEGVTSVAGESAPAAQPEESPEAREEEMIRESLRTKTDRIDLPVDLKMSPSAESGETRELALLTHLVVKPLHFRKDGDHNFNNVAFAVALFDQKDNIVQVKERHAKINVVDAQLPDFFLTGVDVETTFELKPGSYRVRVVVTDAEEHRITAFSRPVEVP